MGDGTIHLRAQGQRRSRVDYLLDVEAVIDRVCSAVRGVALDQQRIGAAEVQYLCVNVSETARPDLAAKRIEQPPIDVSRGGALLVKIEAIACARIEAVEIAGGTR